MLWFTVKRTIRNCDTGDNYKDGPMASIVAEVMANLQTDGLGVVKKIDGTTVFQKQLQWHATEESLQAYGIAKMCTGKYF